MAEQGMELDEITRQVEATIRLLGEPPFEQSMRAAKTTVYILKDCPCGDRGPGHPCHVYFSMLHGSTHPPVPYECVVAKYAI